MLLSIIVPIYNTSKYLEKCLLSIKNQTFSDFECIMVDDGSIDESVKIAQKFINLDSRFKLIKNKHFGLANTMNTALAKVRGKYITFCDSDDYLETTAYESILSLIADEPDLIISNFWFDYDNRVSKNSNYNFHKLTNIQAIKREFPLIYQQQMMYYNANKIYHRKIIDNLSFDDLTVGLDTIFNYQVFAKCQNIYFNEKPYYHYLQRKGSLVNHFDPQRLKIRKIETTALMNLLNQWQVPYSNKLLRDDWFNTLINTVKNVYAPIANNQILPLDKRIYYLKRNLTCCLAEIDIKLLNKQQIKFIELVQHCIDNNNDDELYQKLNI